MPKSKASRGKRAGEKPNERFLKTDENAESKQQNGSKNPHKNPNKKRNKKPTLAEKIAADLRKQALESPPAATRPMMSLDLNARSPTQSPEAPLVSENAFALLEHLRTSPSPVPAKALSPATEPVSAEQTMMDLSPPLLPEADRIIETADIYNNLYDALAVLGDFDSFSLNTPAEDGIEASSELVAEAPAAEVASEAPKSFWDALLVFGDFEFMDFGICFSDVLASPVEETEREVVTSVEIIPEEELIAVPEEEPVEEKPRKRFFMRALKAFGNAVANFAAAAATKVTAAAVHIIHAVRSRF